MSYAQCPMPNAQTKGSVKPVGLFHTLLLLENYIITTKGILIKDSIHHPAGVAVAAAVALTVAHNQVAADSNRQPCT